MNAKLNYVQSLRGIAALLVIWHHSSFMIGRELRDSLLGFTGVPLFFVISGFIMVYTTRNITADVFYNIKEFTIKRLIRILPLFYFVIILWIIVCRKDFIIDPQWVKICETAFFIPHFTDQLGPFYGLWILGANWSLNYEMFFYLLFAVSFIFSDKRYYFLYAVFLLQLIVIPFIITGGISFNRDNYYPYAFEYFNLMSNPILWYFLLGITIGLLIDKIVIRITSQSTVYVCYGLAMIFFILYLVQVLPSNLVFEMLACGMLVLGALLMDLYPGVTVKMPGFMVALGNMSYSVYLMPTVILMYTPLVARKYGVTHLLQSWYTFFIVLSVILMVSSITYYLIEKRLTNYLRDKLL